MGAGTAEMLMEISRSIFVIAAARWSRGNNSNRLTSDESTSTKYLKETEKNVGARHGTRLRDRQNSWTDVSETHTAKHGQSFSTSRGPTNYAPECGGANDRSSSWIVSAGPGLSGRHLQAECAGAG